MDIPFLGKSTDQKINEAIQHQPPPQQQNLDLTGGGDQPARYGYWEQAQDFTEEYEHIKAMLEGKIKNINPRGQVLYEYPKDESGKIIKHRFCTTEGQSWILQFVGPILQKGTTLSNYSIDSVLDRCCMDAEILNETIYIKSREWKIDPTRMGAMVEIIMDRIESARRRSVDNVERNSVKETISTLFNLSGSNQPKQASLFSSKQGGRL